MQLFQEYVVGKVSRSPHMFSINSGDIMFLKQFPAEYWVDALWQRYNGVLWSALNTREKNREAAGYKEFVRTKYHEILTQLNTVDLDVQIKKKRALLQALNLAEEKYSYITVKNKDRIWFLRTLNYEEGEQRRKVTEKHFKGKDYIEELVKSLEGSPMNAKGFDLTGVKKHEHVTKIDTKSQFSSRGFQFPSRDVIRKSLRKWMEYIAADLLNPIKIPESDKKDFTHIKGTEINDLYEKHWRKLYYDFFINLSDAEDLESFARENIDVLRNIENILKNNTIDEVARSRKGYVGVVEYVKARIIKILQPSTIITGLKEIATFLKDRKRCRHLAEVLSKTELRIARKNKTFVDPHDRTPGYDPDTNTDEKLHPKIKMIKVKVMEQDPNDNTKYIEKTVEIPDLKRGHILYPIHDIQKYQNDDYAVGSLSRYEDIHAPLLRKRKVKPFKIVSQEELRKNPEMKKKRIIGGGLVPNQNSPYRSGLLSNEEEFTNKIMQMKEIFRFENYRFERNEEDIIIPIINTLGRISMSQLVVNYLIMKLKSKWKEEVHGMKASFEWSEWAKCLDEISYKKLHDHCVEILSDNYEQMSSKDANKKIRETLDYLFQRMSQLDFGSGTFKQRNKNVKYDCEKINHIIERFYSGDMFIPVDIGSSSREEGRKHDLANRSFYRDAIQDADETPSNMLQLARKLLNAYLPKFSGPDARSSAEICTASFIKGVVSSNQDLNSAVNTEITRLSDQTQKPNCQVEENRNFYKKAIEITKNILQHDKIAVSPEEIAILEKLTNPNTSHYNTRIEKLVKILKERTKALEELISAINSYNPISGANLSVVAEKMAKINSINYDGFIVSDSIKKSVADIFSNIKKMNRLTLSIPDMNIKGIFQKLAR